jgi:hypothetical protein
MSNCSHTYSIVLLLHYSTLMWSSSHESFLNSIQALLKHKDFINYVLFNPILSNHVDHSQLSSQIHILQSIIPLPYLSCYNISIHLKYWTNTFQLFVLFDCDCMVCLCYVILCYSCAKSYVLSWEKWKDRILQKVKWHTYLLPIFILH